MRKIENSGQPKQQKLRDAATSRGGIQGNTGEKRPLPTTSRQSAATCRYTYPAPGPLTPWTPTTATACSDYSTAAPLHLPSSPWSGNYQPTMVERS